MTPMRLRRGPLFWGLLLIPLGGIPLLVRGGVIDPSAFGDAWRLWPLLLIGLGLAVLLGRGRSGLAVTVILALVLGTAGGAALATGGSWIGAFGSCAGTSTATDHLTDGGALGPNGRVELRLDCGEATVGPVGGSAWSLDAELPREPADRHRDRLEPADRLARPAVRPLPALDRRPADRVDARAGRDGERGHVLDRPGRHDARRFDCRGECRRPAHRRKPRDHRPGGRLDQRGTSPGDARTRPDPGSARRERRRHRPVRAPRRDPGPARDRPAHVRPQPRRDGAWPATGTPGRGPARAAGPST